MSHGSTSALVVIEAGGEWPHWLADLPGDRAGRAVIRQDEGEPCARFAERVRLEISSLRGAVEVAVVACNERADDHVIAARRALARSILALVARSGTGNLFFTESERQSGGSRVALAALATDLADAWESVGIHIGVRFGQPSRSPHESEPPPRLI